MATPQRWHPITGQNHAFCGRGAVTGTQSTSHRPRLPARHYRQLWLPVTLPKVKVW
jgi:hypothetical protein